MEQARFSIDMIDMLKEKTRGNLSADIEKLVDSTLLELRMNYVEEVNAESRAKEERGKEDMAEPGVKAEAEPAVEQTAKEPRPEGEQAPEAGAPKQPRKAKKAKAGPRSRPKGQKRAKEA